MRYWLAAGGMLMPTANISLSSCHRPGRWSANNEGLAAMDYPLCGPAEPWNEQLIQTRRSLHSLTPSSELWANHSGKALVMRATG